MKQLAGAVVRLTTQVDGTMKQLPSTLFGLCLRLFLQLSMHMCSTYARRSTAQKLYVRHTVLLSTDVASKPPLRLQIRACSAYNTFTHRQNRRELLVYAYDGFCR